jgi:hypothetical protein
MQQPMQHQSPIHRPRRSPGAAAPPSPPRPSHQRTTCCQWLHLLPLIRTAQPQQSHEAGRSAKHPPVLTYVSSSVPVHATALCTHAPMRVPRHRLRCGAACRRCRCFGGFGCTDRALHVGRAAACLAGPAAVRLPLHPPRHMLVCTLDRPSTRQRLQSGDAELAENVSDAESSAEEDEEGDLLVTPRLPRPTTPPPAPPPPPPPPPHTPAHTRT